MKGNIIPGILFLSLVLMIPPAVTAAGPVANFSGTPATGNPPLTVTFTDRSTGSPTGWAWFFGDETYRQAWTRVNASATLTGRYGQSSVVLTDGSIVMTGGGHGVGLHENDTWRSTDNGTTWKLMNASSGWSNRQWHSSVALPDGSIVLMGGWDSTKPGSNELNDTWRSTNKGKTWTRVNASSGWSERSGQSSVVLPDGSIILMGGAWNDTWRSTDKGSTWTRMNASSGWSARTWQSCVAMPDGSIVLMGGLENGNPVNIGKNDVWRSTNKGATWTRMNASAGWLPRWLSGSVVMADGSIVITGGALDNNPWESKDVWRSKNNGATWTRVNASAGWGLRWGHSSVAAPDGSIVLMCGYGSENTPYSKNDVWRFQPAGSLAKNPVHTYTRPGIYPVALQVFNASGYNSTRKNGYITVGSPTSTITVAVPDGGQNWKQGTSRTITWSYTGNPGAKVKVELLRGTILNRVINASTPVGSGGSGSCVWKIPYNQTPRTDYRIRVTSTSNAAYRDTSNANFTVSAGAPITVTVPDGGQNWNRGTIQPIRWSFTGNPGSFVKIELLKGLALNRTISLNTSIGSGGTGWKNWSVPQAQALGSDYRIRITSLKNKLLNDTSNAWFTISV